MTKRPSRIDSSEAKKNQRTKAKPAASLKAILDDGNNHHRGDKNEPHKDCGVSVAYFETSRIVACRAHVPPFAEDPVWRTCPAASEFLVPSLAHIVSKGLTSNVAIPASSRASAAKIGRG
jgi:hypothetical protein